jgi:hypothetical protein
VQDNRVVLKRRYYYHVKGKQPDGSAKTREAKLGCIFTQTTADAEVITAGYFIGSGVVEAGCKTVVGRRLKH